MELWMKIGSAVLIGAMLVYLLPRLRDMVNATPKGSSSQWMSALIPIALVLLFVLVLTKLV